MVGPPARSSYNVIFVRSELTIVMAHVVGSKCAGATQARVVERVVYDSILFDEGFVSRSIYNALGGLV